MIMHGAKCAVSKRLPTSPPHQLQVDLLRHVRPVTAKRTFVPEVLKAHILQRGLTISQRTLTASCLQPTPSPQDQPT